MSIGYERPDILHLFIVVAFLALCHPAEAGSDLRAPVLRLAGGSMSEDGHVKVEWDLQRAGANVEVQQALDKSFKGAKVVYRGPDKATFISGLQDGTYYYRIRRVDGVWSDPVMLTVKHHSLRLAFTLFSLGAVVFALTVLVVIKGALHTASD